MNYYKKIILGFVSLIFTLAGICGAFYFYDPAQFFSNKYPGYCIDDNRFFARKVIDEYTFDGVIIGSSMLEQTNPKELNIGTFINISMPDSKFHERFYALDYLFRTKNVKHIIVSFDGFGVPHYKNNFQIMYKEKVSIFDKFGLYINGFIPYKCYLTFSKSEKCIGRKHDFYEEVYKHNGRKDYKFDKDDFVKGEHSLAKQYKNEEDLQYLHENFLKFVKENPSTTFHVVIPPYSVLAHNRGNINSSREYYRYYLNEFKEYKNIVVYAFNDENFTFNMNNYYSDKTHYKSWINSRINKAINEGTNIITKDNMDEYFDRFIKKVESYDIKAYEEALRLDIRE